MARKLHDTGHPELSEPVLNHRRWRSPCSRASKCRAQARFVTPDHRIEGGATSSVGGWLWDTGSSSGRPSEQRNGSIGFVPQGCLP